MAIKKPGEGFRGVQGAIGYLLRQAQHVFRLKVEKSLQEFGITHPQFAILCLINIEEGIHAADVARVSLLSPQAVNIILANLENAKLINRTAHETHGRVLILTLTKLGHKRLEQCKIKVDLIQQQMLAGLSPKEEKIIRNWLVRCAMDH